MKTTSLAGLLLSLLYGTSASADLVRCSWIMNQSLVVLDAQITWPGRTLEGTRVRGFNSRSLPLDSKKLTGQLLTTGQFKNHVSFAFVERDRPGVRHFVFPRDFYEKKAFVGYLADAPMRKFDSLSCRIYYIE